MVFSREQIKIINSKPNGHTLIKGTKCTGKTTAFVNKIPSLLNNYCISKDDKVLISTYDEESLEYISSIYKNIAVEKYHQNSFFDRDNSDRLKITTTNSLMLYYFNQYNKHHRKKTSIASTLECKNLLEKAIEIVSDRYEKLNILNIQFIQEEIMWIKACNYMNIDEYQEADRVGRVSNVINKVSKILRKNSRQRQAIYEILVEYNNNLKERKKIDNQDIALLALEEAIKRPHENYTHIFIDNSQDLTKVQLEFLKALYNEKIYSSITFIMDSNQNKHTEGWLTKGRSFASLGYDMKGKCTSLGKSGIELAAKAVKEYKVNKRKEVTSSNLTLAKSIQKKGLANSALTLESIEYIDLKRNVSHKFIKDSGAADEIYIEYDGVEERVEDVLSIPLFNEIAAGSPILINDSIEDNYYLPKEWIRSTKNIFMLKVKGDSMINRNIYDGDYVVISKQNIPSIRDIVAVDIDGEATLKTYKNINGKIALMPENENYEPIIIEDQEFSFLGVAIGLIKNS